jgi:hypothetical protein
VFSYGLYTYDKSHVQDFHSCRSERKFLRVRLHVSESQILRHELVGPRVETACDLAKFGQNKERFAPCPAINVLTSLGNGMCF